MTSLLTHSLTLTYSSHCSKHEYVSKLIKSADKGSPTFKVHCSPNAAIKDKAALYKESPSTAYVSKGSREILAKKQNESFMERMNRSVNEWRIVKKLRNSPHIGLVDVTVS